MINNKVFAIIGGDHRQSFLYEMLREQEFEVVPFGVKGYANTISNVNKIMNISDIVILPVPVSLDGENVNAPYLESKINITKLFEAIKPDQKVFAGMISEELQNLACVHNVSLIDYINREDLAIMNAIPTVEGAIELAIKNTDFTIFGSDSLVLGFGRVGKILSRTLKQLGANVYVAARSICDLTWAKAEGFHPVYIDEMQNLDKYQLIFNTVPSLILNSTVLLKVSKNCLIIDLASIPGGVDFKAAEKLGINTIHALSLPGKVAPKTAAKIIKDTIFNYFREENI